MQRKDYHTSMTDRRLYVTIIAALVCLPSPPVEGSLNHATMASTRVASAREQPSESFGRATPTPSGTLTASMPSRVHGSDAIAGRPVTGSFVRLAFLSHFVHHSYADSRSTRSMSHPRTPSCAARVRRASVLLASENNRDGGSDDNDEDVSIQSLYQQVQEEDPVWFYQTFSKLLDEDPTNKIGASREDYMATIATDDNAHDASGGGGELDSISVDNVDVDVMADDEKLSEQTGKRNGSEMEPISLKDASNGVPRKKVELPTSSSNSTGGKFPTKIPPSRQKTEEEDDHTSQGTVQRAPASIDTVRYYGNIRGEYDTRGYGDDDEYEDSYSDEDDGTAYRKSRPPQRRQPPASESRERPRANEIPRTEPSIDAIPPRIVRLRNAYTGEIENLGPLADLTNMGYTEREVNVLRPQVLDLILEDRIPRPTRGLPKRWVRLSKLDGYKKEGIDEDEDEEFEWEVEVVSGKTLDEDTGLDGLDANESASGRNDSIDKDKPSSVSRESERDTVAKKEITSAVSIPREKQSTEKQQKKNQVVESWGPFASSPVPDTNDDNARFSPKITRGTRKQMQPPINVNENDDAMSGRYDDYETGSADAKRSPNMRGRLDDVKDVDGDPRSVSYKSKPKRSLEDQQRRLRQRPPARRRELLIDRGEDGEPAPNKFWMDLPTFRDFLRKEAQFRLQILGPDWKESVLDESRWRYDLYKTWLTMLDEGVGENPLYEYGDRPDGRRSSPQPRSRGERRRRKGPSERELPERDFDDGKRRTMRPDVRGEGGRERRRRAESRPSLDRRPLTRGGPGSWKNFSDLEESLQRSSQERSERSSPREDESSVEDDYDEFNGEGGSGEPRSKGRLTGRPQRERAKSGSNPSNNREYARSYEGERRESPRRDRRVRYNPETETSQGVKSRKFEKSSDYDYDEPLEE
jgi:hypothetical protein